MYNIYIYIYIYIISGKSVYEIDEVIEFILFTDILRNVRS